MNEIRILDLITPRIKKRYLFFLAALFWTFAGSILLRRGFLLFFNRKELPWLQLMLSSVAGSLFYIFLFSKIAKKHSKRMLQMKNERPCAFSFFNARSYLIMIVMISSGIFVRTSGLLTSMGLMILYFTMGIPLLLSSIRFYSSGIKYKQLIKDLPEE
ncbi:MAG: hypothetical protein Q8T08_21435 [Ignavibacteria bacterium]|nr:hypothetical protein [Ignavibacteria bacterium]